MKDFLWVIICLYAFIFGYLLNLDFIDNELLYTLIGSITTIVGVYIAFILGLKQDKESRIKENRYQAMVNFRNKTIPDLISLFNQYQELESKEFVARNNFAMMIIRDKEELNKIRTEYLDLLKEITAILTGIGFLRSEKWVFETNKELVDGYDSLLEFVRDEVIKLCQQIFIVYQKMVADDGSLEQGPGNMINRGKLDKFIEKYNRLLIEIQNI